MVRDGDPESTGNALAPYIAHSLRGVFADQDNVDVHLAEITKVDTATRTVSTSDGDSWGGDVLVQPFRSRPSRVCGIRDRAWA